MKITMRLILLLSNLVSISTGVYGDGLADLKATLDLNIQSMMYLKENFTESSRNLMEMHDDLGYASRGQSSELAEFKQRKQVIIDKINQLDLSQPSVQEFRAQIEKIKMPEKSPYFEELDKTLVRLNRLTSAGKAFGDALDMRRKEKMSIENKKLAMASEGAGFIERKANEWIKKSKVLTQKRDEWRKEKMLAAGNQEKVIATRLRELIKELEDKEVAEGKVIADKGIKKVTALGEAATKLDDEIQAIEKASTKVTLDEAWKRFEEKAALLTKGLNDFEQEIKGFIARIDDAKKVNVFAQKILGILAEVVAAVKAADDKVDIDWVNTAPLEAVGLDSADAAEIVAIVARARAVPSTANVKDVKKFGADLGAFMVDQGAFLA